MPNLLIKSSSKEIGPSSNIWTQFTKSVHPTDELWESLKPSASVDSLLCYSTFLSLWWVIFDFSWWWASPFLWSDLNFCFTSTPLPSCKSISSQSDNPPSSMAIQFFSICWDFWCSSQGYSSCSVLFVWSGTTTVSLIWWVRWACLFPTTTGTSADGYFSPTSSISDSLHPS